MRERHTGIHILQERGMVDGTDLYVLPRKGTPVILQKMDHGVAKEQQFSLSNWTLTANPVHRIYECLNLWPQSPARANSSFDPYCLQFWNLIIKFAKPEYATERHRSGTLLIHPSISISPSKKKHRIRGNTLQNLVWKNVYFFEPFWIAFFSNGERISCVVCENLKRTKKVIILSGRIHELCSSK